MKVILVKDVPKVGQIDDVKDVSDGYALNFLIPHGLAKKATEKLVGQIEKSKEQKETKKTQKESKLTKDLKNLEGREVVLEEKTNEQGHLFAKVHRDEIVAVLKKEVNIDLGPEAILLEEPIKEVGKFDIPIKVGKAEIKMKLVVKAKEPAS